MDGAPCLTETLSWPGLPIFLPGKAALLQLGPTAGWLYSLCLIVYFYLVYLYRLYSLCILVCRSVTLALIVSYYSSFHTKLRRLPIWAWLSLWKMHCLIVKMNAIWEGHYCDAIWEEQILWYSFYHVILTWQSAHDFSTVSSYKLSETLRVSTRPSLSGSILHDTNYVIDAQLLFVFEPLKRSSCAILFIGRHFTLGLFLQGRCQDQDRQQKL